MNNTEYWHGGWTSFQRMSSKSSKYIKYGTSGHLNWTASVGLSIPSEAYEGDPIFVIYLLSVEKRIPLEPFPLDIAIHLQLLKIYV